MTFDEWFKKEGKFSVEYCRNTPETNLIQESIKNNAKNAWDAALIDCQFKTSRAWKLEKAVQILAGEVSKQCCCDIIKRTCRHCLVIDSIECYLGTDIEKDIK